MLGFIPSTALAQDKIQVMVNNQNEVYKSETFRERNEAYVDAGDMQIFAPEELKKLLEELQFSNVTIEVVEANNWLCCIGEKPAKP